MEIRRLEPRDAGLAQALVRAFKRSAPGAEHLRAWLADARCVLLAALERGAPVGWVYGYELPRIDGTQPMYLLYEIDVAPAHRRRGIGAALLAHIVEQARALGATRVTLLTDGDNARAQALYRRLGFAASSMLAMRRRV